MRTPPAGRILRAAGGVYHVEFGGQVVECSLRGRLKREGTAAAVGDRVQVERLEDGSCRIEAVLPRSSQLARLSLNRRKEQLIAANVDQVAVVVSARTPEPDLRGLDRLLALAELNDLPAFVVLNKVDLLTETSGDDVELPADMQAYVSAGYRVLPTSVRTSVGVAELAQRLTSRITVFAGASGVGKSSLANSLVSGLELRVGTVGDRSGRGKHTTVAARLIPLPMGGYLADTPGIQFVGLAGVGPVDLAHAFPEFRELLGHCRFANCQHLSEPGCALKQAVREQKLDRRRFESFVALARETELRR